MSKGAGDGTVGPWAREKLDSLGQYLHYYTTRLKKQTWCAGLYYVDAFAGPGWSPIRGTGPVVRDSSQGELFLEEADESDEGEIEYLKGSPRVALEVKNPFSHYIFIEKDPDRLQELNALKQEFATTRQIEVLAGDANVELDNLLSRGINWQRYKGLVFLDPFGMHVPWATIEALARTKGLEVIVTFPLGMAINRLLTTSGEIAPASQERLDATFGSPDWRELVYEDQTDLLGKSLKTKRPDAAERLLNWFSGRLRSAFGHASLAQPIKNTRGNALYYLIWAGPHKAGLTGADYILGLKAPKKQALRSGAPVPTRNRRPVKGGG